MTPVNQLMFMWVNFDVRGQQETHLFTGGNVIMDYGLICLLYALELNDLNNGFVSYKHKAFGFTRC